MAHGPVPSQPTLSRSEQREAYFARALREHDYLQGPHIVEWLRKERTARLPDKSWAFLRECPEIIGKIRTREVETLRKCADPFLFVPGAAESASTGMRLLLSSLDPYKATVYRADGPATAILNANGRVPAAYVINEGKSAKRFYFHSLHASLVYDILLATWTRGGPKESVARTLLCDAVDAEVDRVRSTAYQEFDEAVAVLPDGKGIVLADVVILFEQDSSNGMNVRLFDAKEWQDAKLVLTDEFFDTDALYRNVPLSRFLHDKTSTSHVDAWNIAWYLLEQGQDQAEVKSNDDKIIFFSHRRHAAQSMLPRCVEMLK